MHKAIRFLSRRRVGPYVGVVRGGASAEARGREVVLQDADGCQQRLVLPLDGLAVLRDVLRQAAKHLDDAGQDPAQLATVRQRGDLRELARTGLDRLGELFALCVVDDHGAPIGVAVVNGAVINGELRIASNDDTDQELVVATAALDALLALAEDGLRALAGSVAEQAGTVGHA